MARHEFLEGIHHNPTLQDRRLLLILMLACALRRRGRPTKPWKRQVVIRALWWDLEVQKYPRNWYT